MDSTRTIINKNTEKMTLNELISFIVIYDDHEYLDHSLDRIAEMDCPVYACSIDNVSGTGIHPLPYIRDEQGNWTVSGTAQIGTPWTLFIEQDEFIMEDELKKLLSYLKNHNAQPTEIAVERFLTNEGLKRFEWVTTRAIFLNPSRDIKIFHMYELRLLPSAVLKTVDIRNTLNESEQSMFAIRFNSGGRDPFRSNILISRGDKAPLEDDHSIPEDRDIFIHGHQKYFDDTIYCERFIWPSSAYHTLRYHNIPSIIEGLKQGLYSLRIISFALVYLIRFRDFQRAQEIIELMPDYCLDRSPDILSAVGTVYFGLNDYKKSLRYFQRAFELNPESLAATNLLKMLVINENYAELKEVERKYKQKTSDVLQDDFLDYFMSIHKGIPVRTASVSLCMIVKDEQDNLQKAINSIESMVDEIIIVDTGSSDNTMEIADQSSAKVFQFPWSDNFSEARNFAMSKAGCDYIFIMDGDEYISPFNLMELHVIKKLLPLDAPNAYKLSIGRHFNKSDWLFLVSDVGNFTEETLSVRIFPRLTGIKYIGRIGESIEQSLAIRGIPVHTLPVKSMNILHDRTERWTRTKRKCHIYNKEMEPSGAVILSAISDFSFLGDHRNTLVWLKKLFELPMENHEWKLRMGLKIAKSLERGDPSLADHVYQEMMTMKSNDRSVIIAYSDFLLTHNRLRDLAHLPFSEEKKRSNDERTNEAIYIGYESLKYFESGDFEKAFEVLETLLLRTSADLFAQSIRFYFLIQMNRIEGGVAALNDLYSLIGGTKNYTIDTFDELFRIIEDISHVMLDKSCLRERALILQASLSFAKYMTEQNAAC